MLLALGIVYLKLEKQLQVIVFSYIFSYALFYCSLLHFVILHMFVLVYHKKWEQIDVFSFKIEKRAVQRKLQTFQNENKKKFKTKYDFFLFFILNTFTKNSTLIINC